jgi:hypothetical protein
VTSLRLPSCLRAIRGIHTAESAILSFTRRNASVLVRRPSPAAASDNGRFVSSVHNCVTSPVQRRANAILISPSSTFRTKTAHRKASLPLTRMDLARTRSSFANAS